MKALKEDGIALHLGMRNLDGHGAARAGIDSFVNGGHAAAGHEFFDLVVIELITGSDRSHEVVGRANERVEECSVLS
jgi:hypothetical protein